jgi:ketosteroid isomerase-like protein
MSQAANLEIVTRGIDAFNRRAVDALADLTTSDHEFFPALLWVVEGSSYRGREGIERYFVEISDAWEEIQIVAEKIRDLGDRVLVLGRLEGRGRGSGVVVDAPLAFVVDVRGGKMSRTRGYVDHAEALRAAGLAQEAE